MVLSTKKCRDRVKTSGVAKKKIKLEYKGHKKTNYRKKTLVVKTTDCSICCNGISKTHDNSVKCGKAIHFICGECKFKMKESGLHTCPMCRSHPIKNPVSRDIVLPIYKKFPKPESIFVDDISRMSLKHRRNFYRGSPYNMPFTLNTNRIVRERHNWTNRYLDYDIRSWICDQRAFRYNGYMDESSSSDSSSSDEDDSSDYSSDYSSESSTLTLVEGSDTSEDEDMTILSYETYIEDNFISYETFLNGAPVRELFPEQ
jgi:hypothetical protein